MHRQNLVVSGADNVRDCHVKTQKPGRLPNADYLKIAERLALVNQWKDSGTSAEDFEETLKTLRPQNAKSASTVRRWSRYADADRRNGTLTLLGKPRTGRKRAVHNDVLRWVLENITQTPKKKNKARHRELLEWCTLTCHKAPSYPNFNRYVRDTQVLVDRLLLTDDKFLQKHGLFPKRLDGKSNELWVTDACQLKLYVTDVNGCKPFRPWIIVFMDHSSRMIMGWMMTRHTPTSDDVLIALRTAMLPKKFAGVNWCGVPKRIQCDNGSQFCSDLVVANLGRLHIGHEPTEPACPTDNGRQERLFKTVQENFVAGFELSVVCRNLPVDQTAQGLWETLPEKFDRWVTKYNLLTSHSAVKTTPYEAWKERLEDLSSLERDWNEVSSSILVERVYQVQKQGVQLTPGRYWWSEHLVDLRDKSVMVQMPPEGPGKTAPVFFQKKYLGTVSEQDGEPTLAKAIKGAFGDHTGKVDQILAALTAGTVRHEEVLGRVAKNEEQVGPPTKSKRKSKKATGATQGKPIVITPVEKGVE